MRSETDLRGQSREFSSSAPDVVPTGGYYFEVCHPVSFKRGTYGTVCVVVAVSQHKPLRENDCALLKYHASYRRRTRALSVVSDACIFKHDDREDSRGRGRDRRTGDNRRYGEGGGRNPRLSAADTAGMWTHDKFETMDEEEPEVNDAGSSFTRDDRPPRVVEDSDGARGRVFRSDTRGNRGGRDGGVQDRLGFRGDNGRPRDGAWERRNGTGRDRGDTGAVRGATYDRVPRGGMRMDTSGYRDRGGPRWGAQSSRSGGRETQPEWLQRERESRRQAAGTPMHTPGWAVCLYCGVRGYFYVQRFTTCSGCSLQRCEMFGTSVPTSPSTFSSRCAVLRVCDVMSVRAAVACAGSKPDGRSSHSTDSGRNGDNSRREGRDRGRDRSRDRQRDAGDGATGTAKETKLDEELSEVPPMTECVHVSCNMHTRRQADMHVIIIDSCVIVNVYATRARHTKCCFCCQLHIVCTCDVLLHAPFLGVLVSDDHANIVLMVWLGCVAVKCM